MQFILKSSLAGFRRVLVPCLRIFGKVSGSDRVKDVYYPPMNANIR